MSRNNTPITPNTPLSFKTVPGRHRTQKWNKAPSYNYDGDEWGGYDPYDEYGGPDEPPPPPPPVPAQVPYGAPRGRKSSFDRGDDGRQFSAPATTSSLPSSDPRRPGGPGSAASGGRGSNDFPRSRSRPREFTNPDQVPQPLSTKPAPPPPQWFPPRKSSLSGNDVASKAQADEARAIAAELSSANTDKPLPFIRPSDIYKRIPDEIRRQSEDGSRPSMDSLQRESSPQKLGLEPVQESRESRLFMDDEAPRLNVQAERVAGPSMRSELPSLQTAPAPSPPARSPIQKEASPTLPAVSRFSGFGDDFFSDKKPVNTDTEAIATSSEPARDVANVPVENTTGVGHTQSTFSSIQNTPTTTTRAAPGQDPAAEILAERQHDVPVDDITNQNASALQHQPSQGFRSAVHQAFDRGDNSTPSRDSSQSGPGSGGVSRSDTTSTAGISPIMSRVPSAATAQLGRQQRLEGQVPPIAEEPSSATPTGTRPASGQYSIPRKPSPGHGRSDGVEATPSQFEPGYRRSLDPPSTGTSPGRTPILETTANKRLSTPMSAVHMTEAPDVADQAAEVPEPTLEPAETPASEYSQIGELGGPTVATVASRTRGRSSTDYSAREADLADTVNASPDQGTAAPAIAEAQRDSQKLFLETHTGTASSPGRSGTGFSGTGTPTRADSPAKGRVREIADKYHEIHSASRRNSAASVGSSKSSWSNFDATRLKGQGTSQSQSGVDSPETATRPELGREESFRPDLPGGWISPAPTPALESPLAQPEHVTPRQSTTAEEVDLTPTTKKRQLPSVEPTSATSTDGSKNPFDAVKGAGDQLGAALLSSYGIGHQTRDFASKEPPAPVDQPEARPKPERGSIAMQPPLIRHETDSTDAPSSVASSVPPAPPIKDGNQQPGNLAIDSGAGYFNTVAPLRVRSREPSPEQQSQFSPHRSNVVSTMSTDTASDDMESDRLRNEIVRSLDPIKKDELQRESIQEDAERTQDGLDAPDNERRIEHGTSALPAAEVTAPRLLTTRFSWESSAPAGPAPVAEPEPKSPEIRPEMAYERPRSKALHVMNPEDQVESPLSPVEPVPVLNEPTETVAESLPAEPSTQPGSMVSPIEKSQEHLLPETNMQSLSPSQSLQDVAPSPISDNGTFNSRLPSYYLEGHDNEEEGELPHPPEKDHTAAPSMSPAPRQQPKPAGPIQPFRSILAMKSGDERIKTYNETRQTFADMNTGLNDWLSMMLEQHPEHANLSTSNEGFKPAALQSSGSGFGTLRKGHKASPSIAKFANKFGADDKQRQTSVGSTGNGAEPMRPTTAGGDGPRLDMDKMQQRGQKFLKQAGVFGGKAQEGAKGLFAKGKSRFGGGSVRGKSGNEASPSPSAATSSSNVASAAASSTAVASPLAKSMVTANETATNLSAVHETTENPTEPVNPPKMPADELPRPSEKDITTEPDRDAPALSTQHDEPTATLPPIEQTLSIATAAAPPAEEAPSSSAFISSSPALAPISRSTSTSASPFRRPRSRTPSSTGTGSRPLSQVFGRLRSISRSSTTSRRDKASQSRSRPASMVLGNPDLLESQNEDVTLQDIDATHFALNDFSDVAATSRPEATRSTSTSSFSVMGVRSTERRVDSWEEPSAKSNSPGPGITRVMSMASPTRTEAWNEPDAQIPPPKTAEERGGTPRRLGILPSPAPTASAFEEGKERRASGETRRRRSSAVAWRPSGETGNGESEGAELETVPSEDDSRDDGEDMGEEKVEVKDENVSKEAGGDERPAPIRKESDLAVLPSQRGEVQEPDDASPTSIRPQRPRKMSDLELLPSRHVTDDVPVVSLPSSPPPTRPEHGRTSPDLKLLASQRRLSPLNVTRPDRMTLTTLNVPSNESVDVEGEVHEASPVTIKEMSPPVVVNTEEEKTPVAGKTAAMRLQEEEEEDLYESTPTAESKTADEDLYENSPVTTRTRDTVLTGAETDRKVSTTTNSTTADYEDARSDVSAEEGAQLENSRHSTNPTTSRHSSVSSLGTGAREAATEEPPVMSAQAVPAGPIGASPHTIPDRPHVGVLQELTAAAATRRQEQRPPALLQTSRVETAGTQQGFAIRQQRPGIGERPMSYIVLPRDDHGLPVQETISTDRDDRGPPLQTTNLTDTEPSPIHPTVPVDLSGIAGPPPGAPPFAQHPAIRNSGGVQPTEYERLRSSVVSTESGHTPQWSGDMGGRPPSGFFRGRPSTDPSGAVGGAPPPSRISDQYGVEGVHAYGQVGGESQARSQQEEKQGSRRSGLWETLTSRRSSAQRFDSSRDSSVAPLDNFVAPAEAVVDAPATEAPSDSKRKTLKKPQRASSSAVETEPKKKRFSKLGSLFGRSSTTGGNTPKTNRLTKNVPPTRETSTAQQSQKSQQQPSNSSTVVGSVRGYAAYEAARRRDMPAFQENAANVQAPRPTQTERPSLTAEDVEPPPGGWYGPQASQEDRPAPPTEAPRPDFPGMHSESRRGERGLAQVPEAFRPVQSSFSRPVEPIGPPPGQEPRVERDTLLQEQSWAPNYPAQTPSAVMEMMMDPNQPRRPQQPVREASYPGFYDPNPPPPRHPSYGSEQFTPSNSGRSEYYAPGSRPFGSLPSISPVQSRTGQQQQTIPEETARSPAREYPDQQTPWAITLPQGGGAGQASGRSSRASSWGMAAGPGPGYDRRGSYDARGPLPEGYGYAPQHAPPPPPPPQYRPMPPRNQGLILTDPANVGFYPPPPRGQPRPIYIPWEEEQPIRRQQDAGPYPPHLPQYPGYSTPPSHPQQYAPPPGYARGPPGQQYQGPPRFYARQYSGEYPPPQQQQQQQQRQYSGDYGARPMHSRRPSSGYSGRRDDMAVGEEELVMRGASYPGQEWAPPGLGRSGGWD